MLVRRTFGFLIGMTLTLTAAHAGDCDSVNATDRTAIRDALALEKRVATLSKTYDEKPGLIFAIPNADDPAKESTLLFVEADPAKDRLEIPRHIANQLAEAKDVKVFNRTNVAHGNGTTSESPVFYFVPYPVDGLKGMNLGNDFLEAETSKRKAGLGCTTLNLKGRTTITALYGPIAANATDLVFLQKTRASTTSEKYVDAVRILKKKLGIVGGVSRAPATLERPVYSDTGRNPKIPGRRKEKKLPLDQIGSPHDPSKVDLAAPAH